MEENNLSIQFEEVSKKYLLGQISHGMIYKDIQSWIAKLMGKPDPNDNSIIGQIDGKNLHKNKFYNALIDINLSIHKGDILGIIGKNGAGKSTLLKLLSRVTSPSNGIIKINGKIASLLEVGTGFHPDLTGRENVFLNGSILGMSKQEITRKFDEIVDFSGIKQFIDTPVKRYSSGMYVRLAFAVAAHLEPDILVVDEVLAVGDIEFQRKCIGKMNSISKSSGRTIIFVSHNMAAISSLCNRVVYLMQGKIIYDGNVKEGIDYYLKDNQNDMKISLSDRKDRIGAGDIKFIETWTETIKGIRRNLFLTGEDIVIVTKIQINSQVAFKKLTAAYAIKDSQDYQITDLNTMSIGIEFENPKNNEAELKCIIFNAPFTSGTYLYNSIVRTDNSIQDFIQNIGSFEIEEGDFYQTGKTIEKGQGVILVKQQWEIFYSNKN